MCGGVSESFEGGVGDVVGGWEWREGKGGIRLMGLEIRFWSALEDFGDLLLRNSK